MKRLILMGGRPWEAADKGERQVEVLLRYFPAKVKLAFCIFAQPEGDWEETRALNVSMIECFKGECTIAYQTMTLQNFAEVSEWADVIYMPGGKPPKLKAALEACGDVAKLWDGKVIVGASAGMDILCEHFSYLQEKTILEGFGWIKANCIPHWRNVGEDAAVQTQAEAELLRRFPETPLLCVAEGDFIEVSVA
ncbi:MAG TPA: Type 1 glutamine amidotransferase-like domain-containing protein [Candidatus Saccharimonadales bacterium]